MSFPQIKLIRKRGLQRLPGPNETSRAEAKEGGEGTSPWARRVRRIRGSERKKVWRIRKKRIGKKKSSEDQKNGGRSTRRHGVSADVTKRQQASYESSTIVAAAAAAAAPRPAWSSAPWPGPGRRWAGQLGRRCCRCYRYYGIYSAIVCLMLYISFPNL